AHLIDDPSSTRIGQLGSFDAKDYKLRYKSSDGARWTGPGSQDMWTDSNYIDVSLDCQTWAWLRTIQVVRAHLEAGNRPLAARLSAQPAVAVRMLASDRRRSESNHSLWQLDVGRPRELQGNDCQGWMVNAGMPVLTVDWLPVRPAGLQDTMPDYVAAGGMAPGSDLCSCLEQTNFERDKDRTPGVIQIWRADAASHDSPDASCRLDMVLTHSFGDCWALRWCPISIPAPAGSQRDDALPTLGILAAIFADGYLRVCPVPSADAMRAANSNDAVSDRPIYMQWPQRSLAEIRAPRGVFTALEWVTSDVLVAGTSTGLITAWSIQAAVSAQYARGFNGDTASWPYTWQPDLDPKSPSSGALHPMVNHQVHAGAVIALSTYATDPELVGKRRQLRTPADVRLTDPSKIQVFSSGRDGRIHQTLLSLPARHNRALLNIPGHLRCCQVSWLMSRVLYTDGDNCLRLNYDPVILSTDPVIRSSVFQITAADGAGECAADGAADSAASSTGILNPEGSLCHVSLSPFHTYLAAGTTDGTLDIQNFARIDIGRKGSPMFRRVYGLLWDRALGDRGLACVGRGPVEVRSNPTKHYLTQIYPPHVAIQTSAWSRNPASATWIVSAGIGGIIRIDNVGSIGG
ncbi:hypothetical protein LPJ56_004713, partial [Coemansia sp. RSA 2599]